MELKVLVNEECMNDSQYISSCTNSYMTKDDLIKILQTTDFYAVQNFSVECITSFVAEKNKDGKTIVSTRGFNIRID